MDDLTELGAERDETAPSDRDQPRTPSEVVRTRESQMATRSHSRDQDWRAEFPYRWRADDLVTRRDTLRFLVACSGRSSSPARRSP